MLALLGCTPPVPLDEVPIMGGTDEQRAVVEQGLAEFETLTGGGRVELDKIVFEPIEGASGQYLLRPRRVRLDEQLSDSLRAVLRHELCHALDDQEGLLIEERTPVDDWMAFWFEENGPHRALSADLERDQALAEWCEGGPLQVALLSESCFEEPPEITALAAWIADEVWTAYALPSVETPSPTASWTAAFEPGALYASPTDDPSVIHLSLVAAAEEGGYDHQWAYLDLHSGEWLSPTGDYHVTGDYEHFPVVLDPHKMSPYNSVAAASGEAGVSLGVDTFLGERQVRRALYWDGQTLFNAGCLLDVFEAEDRIWGVWAEGATVRWAPLGD